MTALSLDYNRRQNIFPFLQSITDARVICKNFSPAGVRHVWSFESGVYHRKTGEKHAEILAHEIYSTHGLTATTI